MLQSHPWCQPCNPEEFFSSNFDVKVAKFVSCVWYCHLTLSVRQRPMKPTFGFLERRLKLGAKTRLMWQASIVPFLFGFSSPGLILDPWSRSLTMIHDPALFYFSLNFLWVYCSSNPWSLMWLVRVVPFFVMFCSTVLLMLPPWLASPFHAQLGSRNLMSCQRWKYKRTRG